MDGRSAVGYVTIVVLAAMAVPASAAPAQGDDGGIKGVLKWGVSQAIDPPDEVNTAFAEAKYSICDLDPRSFACTVAIILTAVVWATLAVSGLTATYLLVKKGAELVP